MKVCLNNGRHVDLSNPDLTGLTIHHIARSLAFQCRFNGNTSEYYSVARHSAIGAVALLNAGHRDAARAFLLHDAHEQIIGDKVTPVAVYLGEGQFIDLKMRLDREIQMLFDVDFSSHLVASMDKTMLYYEWRELMPTDPRAEGIDLIPTVDLTAHEQERIALPSNSPRSDEMLFLYTAKSLGMIDHV